MAPRTTTAVSIMVAALATGTLAKPSLGAAGEVARLTGVYVAWTFCALEAAPADPLNQALQDRAYERAVELVGQRLSELGQAPGDQAKAKQEYLYYRRGLALLYGGKTRPAIATLAPQAASTCAKRQPRPEVAPVTRATWSARSSDV